MIWYTYILDVSKSCYNIIDKPYFNHVMTHAFDNSIKCENAYENSKNILIMIMFPPDDRSHNPDLVECLSYKGRLTSKAAGIVAMHSAAH